VIRTLHGWKTTRLIAAKDGAGVVIYSEWGDPRSRRGDAIRPSYDRQFPKSGRSCFTRLDRW
jgi:hypothetical protein